MKNIKNNNLTLKTLQAEIEKIKADKEVEGSHSFTENPKSRRQKLLERLWFCYAATHSASFTALLLVLNRIPVVGKFMKIITIWYGRTTWFKILLTLRRWFIIANACIGIFFINKASGFGSDNIIYGIHSIGVSYIEMLGRLIKGVFNWICDFLNVKVVPNPKPPVEPDLPWWRTSRPGYPSENRRLSTWTYWNSRPMTENGLGRIFDVYHNIINKPSTPQVNTSTTSWGNSWLWYTGIALVSVGLLYLGVKLITDPSWVGIGVTKPTPPPTGSAPDITINDIRNNTGLLSGIGAMLGGAATGVSHGLTSGAASIGHGISSGVSSIGESIVKVLNPWTYASTQNVVDAQFDIFMKNQANLLEGKQNRAYYPFTENNPFDPWYKRLRLSIYGETSADSLQRVKDLAKCNAQLESIRVRDVSHPGTPKPLGVGVSASRRNTYLYCFR